MRANDIICSGERIGFIGDGGDGGGGLVMLKLGGGKSVLVKVIPICAHYHFAFGGRKTHRG